MARTRFVFAVVSTTNSVTRNARMQAARVNGGWYSEPSDGLPRAFFSFPAANKRENAARLRAIQAACGIKNVYMWKGAL